MASVDWFTLALLFGGAFIPPILYAVWIRNTEHYDREPWGRIAATFFYGALFGVMLALLFTSILIQIFDYSLPGWIYDAETSEGSFFSIIIFISVIVPLSEEFAKECKV